MISRKINKTAEQPGGVDRMASLTSNPMEDMMEEEDYGEGGGSVGGYRRSWSNPGPATPTNTRPQPPNSLRLTSGPVTNVLK